MKGFRSFSVILSVLLLAGCGSTASTGGVSLDEEWQFGNQLAAQVAQQVKLVDDPQALAYIRSVGARIHAQTPVANRPFEFEIVDDPSVNAFAIPGGHIYVHRGLIANAQKADELASVLAHEIAHVSERHVIEQLVRQQQIGAIGSILLGQNPGQVQQIIASIVAGGAMARFSREQEQEADRVGLEILAKAGFDPNGMVDMFQRLLSLEQGRPGAVERFFRDHPLTQDRITDIRNRISSMSRASGIRDEPEFQTIRRRMGGT